MSSPQRPPAAVASPVSLGASLGASLDASAPADPTPVAGLPSVVRPRSPLGEAAPARVDLPVAPRTPPDDLTDATPVVDLDRRAAFSHSGARFARPRGADLLTRNEPLLAWVEERLAAGVFPYGRTLLAAPGPTTAMRDGLGVVTAGVNVASQDYLALARRPSVVEAAVRAVRDFGVHSAGSGLLSGTTSLACELAERFAEHLRTPHVVLFPTGWGAAFGAVTGLVRPGDHVVLDELSHASLQQGATAATRHVHRYPHLDVTAAREILTAVRARDAHAGILVVTEGLFSMDADVGPVAALQGLCRELGATLLVDVAHDLGVLGPDGTGVPGAQGVLGDVDVIVGAFSKAFASNGGLVAVRTASAGCAIRGYGGTHTFSNALAPAQAAVVLETLRIVRSPEGDVLRAAVLRGAARLRARLADAGLGCGGEVSPIVPVPVGSEVVARIASALLARRGVLANLAEFPAVAAGTARFRMQVMADHTDEHLDLAADAVAGAVRDAALLAEGARLTGR